MRICRIPCFEHGTWGSRSWLPGSKTREKNRLHNQGCRGLKIPRIHPSVAEHAAEKGLTPGLFTHKLLQVAKPDVDLIGFIGPTQVRF